jgi:hypothetical protein
MMEICHPQTWQEMAPMFFLFRSKNASAAHRRRPRQLSFESLEDRTLLTFFSVVDVPDASAMQEASADVSYTRGEQQSAQMAVNAQAHPAGMGDHAGYFAVGSKSPAFVIDTTPEPGQKIGDPIAVSFEYNYAAVLRFVIDFPQPLSSDLTFFARLEAGNNSQDLFKGSFSSDYGEGDQEDDQVLLLPMNVGDQAMIIISAQGEAHAAEPHFQYWVDFSATFTFQDDPAGTPVGHPGERAALLDALAQNHLLQQWLGGPAPNGRPTGLSTHEAGLLDFREPRPLSIREAGRSPHLRVGPATDAQDLGELRAPAVSTLGFVGFDI